MAARQELNETIDWITRSLGAFVALAIVWVALDTLASATASAAVGLLAGFVFTLGVAAMILVVVFAGSLLLK